jgi:hypothetical protein
MTLSFSPFAINALADVITGGGANDVNPPPGIYRSAGKLADFFIECGFTFQIDGSRVPSVRAKLQELMFLDPSGRDIATVLEHVADPRQYLNDPDTGEAVIGHLNRALEADGLEVATLNWKAVLRRRGTGGAVVNAFVEKSATLSFDTVSRDINRAIENADHDPEDAVTAACATLEAVCRSILVELDLPLPGRKDVSGLVRAVQEPLDLSPGRSDLPEEIADDIRQVLNGLTTTAKGIGALRTHGGDAHGRERGRRPIDARIARLAIHSASTVALFFIETWERKQKRALPNRGARNE